jgi:hypothetical protein
MRLESEPAGEAPEEERWIEGHGTAVKSSVRCDWVPARDPPGIDVSASEETSTQIFKLDPVPG